MVNDVRIVIFSVVLFHPTTGYCICNCDKIQHDLDLELKRSIAFFTFDKVLNNLIYGSFSASSYTRVTTYKLSKAIRFYHSLGRPMPVTLLADFLQQLVGLLRCKPTITGIKSRPRHGTTVVRIA